MPLLSLWGLMVLCCPSHTCPCTPEVSGVAPAVLSSNVTEKQQGAQDSWALLGASPGGTGSIHLQSHRDTTTAVLPELWEFKLSCAPCSGNLTGRTE